MQAGRDRLKKTRIRDEYNQTILYEILSELLKPQIEIIYTYIKYIHMYTIHSYINYIHVI